MVAEEVHSVGDPGEGHRHPHERVGVRDRGEGGEEGVHTGAEPQELPGGADHGGEAVILGAVLLARGGDQLARVLHCADELVVPRPAGVELYERVQHHSTLQI